LFFNSKFIHPRCVYITNIMGVILNQTQHYYTITVTEKHQLTAPLYLAEDTSPTTIRTREALEHTEQLTSRRYNTEKVLPTRLHLDIVNIERTN
jgi:hypothetical protein